MKFKGFKYSKILPVIAFFIGALGTFFSFRTNSGNNIAIETPEGIEVVNVPTGSAVVMDENDNISFLDYGVSGSDPLMKSWALDTLTNAANDTLTYSAILASPYQYSYQITLANISGTRNIKFYLEQTNATGSTRWMKVDSAITSGSAINAYLMKGQNVWGNKHRVIADGTGTQSTSYRVEAIYKKTR